MCKTGAKGVQTMAAVGGEVAERNGVPCPMPFNSSSWEILPRGAGLVSDRSSESGKQADR